MALAPGCNGSESSAAVFCQGLRDTRSKTCPSDPACPLKSSGASFDFAILHVDAPLVLPLGSLTHTRTKETRTRNNGDKLNTRFAFPVKDPRPSNM